MILTKALWPGCPPSTASTSTQTPPTSPRRAAPPQSQPQPVTTGQPSRIRSHPEATTKPAACSAERIPRRIYSQPMKGERERREEGREKEQPQHMNPQPASTYRTPPACPTVSPQRPQFCAVSIPPAGIYQPRRQPCLLLPVQFCFWRENRTPAHFTPYLLAD